MDATEALWAARDPLAPVLDGAALFTGLDRSVIERARRASAVLSDEAGAVLRAMHRLDRILTSTQRDRTEICVHSVRGPIAWSETMTARANALGNDDVFVCKTSERSLDTVGNRLVVGCLTAIARADPDPEILGTVYGADQQALIAARADEARQWLAMAVMARIPSKIPSGRELTGLRSGRRAAEFRALIAFSELCNGGVAGSLLGELAGPRTRELHTFVRNVVSVVAEHADVPSRWKIVRGAMARGPITFRHPARPGPGVPGLSLRGVPLLPPERVVEGAPWAGELPARGQRVLGDQDVIDVMKKMDLTGR